MSASTRSVLVPLVALSCFAAGCGDSSKKIDLGGGCLLNSDCNAPLSCTFGKCHTTCVETRDCPLGQSCAKTAEGSVCQFPVDSDCQSSGGVCPDTSQICAADQRCRKSCQTAADCLPGQDCSTGGACADGNDLDPDGQIIESGVGKGCVTSAECNSSLTCAVNRCHYLCQDTSVCPTGQSCVKTGSGSVCQLPVEALCDGSAPCPGGLVCAADYQCRAACSSAGDCTPGQKCAGGVCADSGDLNPSGQLTPKSPPEIRDAGVPDAAMPDIPGVSPADVALEAQALEAGPTYDAPAADREDDSSDAPLVVPGLDGGDGAGIDGASAAGGAKGTGGAIGTGGSASTDGAAGSGGAAGTGGVVSTGGSAGAVVCPSTGGPSMVKLPEDYCIDSTEVTREQYQAWLATNPAPPDATDENCAWKTDYTPQCQWPSDSRKAKHPVVCVDWCDADAYCRGVGKHLCGRVGGGPVGWDHYADASLDEWTGACMSGAAGNAFPYGSTLVPLACNGYEYGVEDTVEAGSIPSCQSGVAGYQGVFDLSGNVLEWEDSCNGTGRSSQCRRRGGSFYGGATYYGSSDYLACTFDYFHVDVHRDTMASYMGFRCCFH
jgi:sulfatase modifying factor 1